MPDTRVAYVVHALPRRVHLRAPPLVGQSEACRRVAELLAEDPGAHEMVSVRVTTGSVVLVAKEGALEPEALLARLRELVEAERDAEGTRLIDRHSHAPTGPTRISRAVARAFSQLNGDVRSHLHHHADLSILLPVGLATLGVVHIAVTRVVPAPAWFTLFWWSMRAFVSFNGNAIAEAPKGP